MPNQESISLAYEQLLARCQPLDVAALPGALPVAIDGAFQSPGAAALEGLLDGDVPGDAWLASGVFENVETRTVAASLAEPGAPLIALRGEAKGAVTDILTQRGCLSGKLPALAMLADVSTRKLLKATSHRVYFTFHIDDLITLRSWGIAAVPATGLEALSPDDWRKLSRRLGLCDSNDASASSSESMRRYFPKNQLDIVFVGWSPARLDRAEPVALGSVGRFWSQLENVLGVDLGSVGLWRPDESDADRLAFLQKFGEPQMLSATVFAQMDDLPALTGSFPCVPKKVEPVLTLQKAQELLIGAMTNPKATPAQIGAAQAAFHVALDREVIQSLVDDANRTALPQDRTIKFLLASAVELAVMQVPRLFADIANGLDQNSVTAKLVDARFHRCEATLDRIVKLRAELPK